MGSCLEADETDGGRDLAGDTAEALGTPRFDHPFCARIDGTMISGCNGGATRFHPKEKISLFQVLMKGQ